MNTMQLFNIPTLLLPQANSIKSSKYNVKHHPASSLKETYLEILVHLQGQQCTYKESHEALNTPPGSHDKYGCRKDARSDLRNHLGVSENFIADFHLKSFTQTNHHPN